jgi:hypothetical protein
MGPIQRVGQRKLGIPLLLYRSNLDEGRYQCYGSSRCNPTTVLEPYSWSGRSRRCARAMVRGQQLPWVQFIYSL